MGLCLLAEDFSGDNGHTRVCSALGTQMATGTHPVGDSGTDPLMMAQGPQLSVGFQSHLHTVRGRLSPCSALILLPSRSRKKAGGCGAAERGQRPCLPVSLPAVHVILPLAQQGWLQGPNTTSTRCVSLRVPAGPGLGPCPNIPDSCGLWKGGGPNLPWLPHQSLH